MPPVYSIIAAVLSKQFTARIPLIRPNDHLLVVVLNDRGEHVELESRGRTAKRMSEFLIVHNIYRLGIDDQGRLSTAERVQ